MIPCDPSGQRPELGSGRNCQAPTGCLGRISRTGQLIYLSSQWDNNGIIMEQCFIIVGDIYTIFFHLSGIIMGHSTY